MKKLEYVIFAFLALALGTGATVNTGCSNFSRSPTSGLEEDDALLSDKVDRLFAKWDKSDSPGAAVVVLKNGKIVHQQGYGMANLEYGIPITPATIFDMASVSKQFTAMAIAILAKQQKISLDDDIRKYLPDIPDFGKTITIRHLLHHTSGLRSWGFLMQLEGLEWDDRLSYAHILQLARYQKELNYAFGLVMGEYRGIKTVHHSGGWAGFRTHIVLFPSQKFNVALLSNLSTMKPMPLANKIADIYLADDLALEKPKAKQKNKKPVKRIQSLNKKQLNEYLGRYYSDELCTSYIIIPRNGQLWLSHIRKADIKLIPNGSDQFTGNKWHLQQVYFERDINNNVTGLRANGGDGWVRNLYFAKQIE